MPSLHDINRTAWDRMVDEKQPFTLPAVDDDFSSPLASLDLAGWLPSSLTYLRVLCLAAGGGRQSALFAAAGAEVTVVDLSPAMLALDREVAAHRGLNLRTIEGSMDDLGMLEAASFDLIYQPVSSCYVSSLSAVYGEVARVIRAGGLYISQHKQPTSLQASIDINAAGRYEIVEPYYLDRPLRTVDGTVLRERGTQEFLHRWEELVGGLCRAGFVVEDLIEPLHASNASPVGRFGHRARYLAPYVRIKARRLSAESVCRPSIWTPWP